MRLLYVSTDKLELEKLDVIYICTQCKIAFLFKSDVIDHKQIAGHYDVKAWPLT